MLMTAKVRNRHLQTALGLAIFTVVYNIIEGLVSVWLGLADETLSLVGFGIDSFVEVVSGIGIWHLVWRIRRLPNADPDRFERTALKVTAVAFYLLAAGLVTTAGWNLYSGHTPVTTLWGTVVALVSISFMWALIHYKLKVGQALNSAAIVADAHCSRACMHFSIVLLVASLGYQVTGIGHIDALGALAIAWLAWREGREAWGKAQGTHRCGCSGGCAI